jgi:hypothetical protein
MRGIGARDPTAVAVRNGSSTSTPAVCGPPANPIRANDKIRRVEVAVEAIALDDLSAKDDE